MSVLRERIAVSHPQQVFSFVEADLAASQSDTDLHRVATSSTAKIDSLTAVMPWSGSIVAIAVKLSGNKTGGTLTINPTVNGTDVGLGASVANSASTAYAETYHGQYRFNAGDELGSAYTTDGSFAPTTLDAAVDVYVVFDDVGV